MFRLYLQNYNSTLKNVLNTNFRCLSCTSYRCFSFTTFPETNRLFEKKAIKSSIITTSNFIQRNLSIPTHYLKSDKNMSTEVSKNVTGNQTSKVKDESAKVNALTTKEKFKRAIKEYGSTVIVFHITISLISLGLFYLLVSSGVDVIAILNFIGINTSKFMAGTSTFVLAYAIHKIFAPVRMGITIGATPIIVRYLRKKKLIK